MKNEDQALTSNFRPVSLNSLQYNCVERIIRNHTIENVNENGILSPTQYDFISGRSTVLQLINVLDNLTLGLHNGNYTDVIYMNFQKKLFTLYHTRG